MENNAQLIAQCSDVQAAGERVNVVDSETEL